MKTERLSGSKAFMTFLERNYSLRDSKGVPE